MTGAAALAVIGGVGVVYLGAFLLLYRHAPWPLIPRAVGRRIVVLRWFAPWLVAVSALAAGGGTVLLLR